MTREEARVVSSRTLYLLVCVQHQANDIPTSEGDEIFTILIHGRVPIFRKQRCCG